MARPLIRTVQAPQAPSEQPSLTDVSLRSSLRNLISFLSFSEETFFPFTVSVTITRASPC